MTTRHLLVIYNESVRWLSFSTLCIVLSYVKSWSHKLKSCYCHSTSPGWQHQRLLPWTCHLSIQAIKDSTIKFLKATLISQLLGRKAMTKLDSVLKSRDTTLPTKVHIVKGMAFPVVMYRCESWTIKKAEWQRTDGFELWCWRKFLRPLDCKI